jgi:diguanylate cyclase (GGDEF)-like protein
MRASSLTSRLKQGVMVQNWLWWRLPLLLRIYVGAMPVAAVAAIGVAAAYTDWRLSDLAKFLVLVTCGMISVASTPKIMYTVGGGVTRDFSSIWVLPTAILLPPVYAALVAIPIVGTLHIFVHRGVPHRMVFTAAGLSLSSVAASLAFHAFPLSFAGTAVGSRFHAFTWCLAVAACEILGGRVQHFMIVGAVKLTNPKIRLFMAEFNRNNLQALFVEIDLGVLITLSVALSPALVVIALPSVLLVRRFLIFPILEAQSRVDAKTGLLNVSTWESEAESELSRAVRTRNPMALALVDIDHFKLVNDTYGHLAGDRVLKGIADALTGQSRDYDRVGRFGGEEFVLLLAQTTGEDARNIAERLRGYVASLDIPTNDRPGAPTLRVTISIGVTALARGEAYELTDLLAAADSAMYAAKQAGRNQVAFAPPLRDMGLDTAWRPAAGAGSANGNGAHSGARQSAGTPLGNSPLSGHQVELVQTERTAASLCPRE